MNRDLIKHIGVGILFILSQLLLFQYLDLFGATVDALLIFLIWLMLKYDRTATLIFAASLAFLQDAFFDTWGINMFTKVLAVFIAHRFVSRNSSVKLLSWQVFAAVFIISIVHNLIYLGFSSFLDVYTLGYSPIILLLGNSLYTSIIGTVLFILKGDNN